MNRLFFGVIVVAVVTGAFTGTMPQVMEASFLSARAAVELAIGLVGQLTLWLGLIGVLREAGALRSVANGLRPVMRRLFPDVPVEHPALSSMIMNLAANLIGLGDAATPFGLKAMRELEALNPRPGTATNAMVRFIAINTAGVVLVPINVIAIRSSLGSTDPAVVIIPTLLATISGVTAALLAARALEGPAETLVSSAQVETEPAFAGPGVKSFAGGRLTMAVIGLAVVAALGLHVWKASQADRGFEVLRGLLSGWLLPLLILAIVTLGVGRRVKVYETFVDSAREGFQTAVSIIPVLVGMLVAFGMFRASGALGFLGAVLEPLLAPVRFPPEALPMVLIRPFSGSGALGFMTDAMRANGPDSFTGIVVSVLNGSVSTTFYVLALYFGAVKVTAWRHAIAACAASMVVGPVVGFVVCRVWLSA